MDLKLYLSQSNRNEMIDPAHIRVRKICIGNWRLVILLVAYSVRVRVLLLIIMKLKFTLCMSLCIVKLRSRSIPGPLQFNCVFLKGSIMPLSCCLSSSCAAALSPPRDLELPRIWLVTLASRGLGGGSSYGISSPHSDFCRHLPS